MEKEDIGYIEQEDKFTARCSIEMGCKLDLYEKYKLKRKMLGLNNEFIVTVDKSTKALTLLSYIGNRSKVVIPGFISCIWGSALTFHEEIEEIILCEGVRTLEFNSIKCKNLKIVDLPNSIVDITLNEFKDNKRLQEIIVHSERMYKCFIDESHYCAGKVKLIRYED